MAPRPIVNPCFVCAKCVRKSQRGIFCDLCSQWVHLSCTSLSISDYKLIADSSDDWYCHKCTQNCFPFNSIDDDIQYQNCIYNLQKSDALNLDWIKNSNQLNLVNRAAAVNTEIDPDTNFLKANCKKSDYVSDEEFNNLIAGNNINSENFSCLHVNIRSLNKNIDKLLQLTAELNHSFSVICVSETWANESNKLLFNLPGYNCIMKPRSDKIGGGVALYIRDDLSFTARSDLCLINCDDVDSAFIQLCIGKCNFIVGIVYRPPDQNLPVFNTAYSMLLDKIAAEKILN